MTDDIEEGERILNDFLGKTTYTTTNDEPDTPCKESDELQKCMAALKKKDEEVKELGNLLKATQEELEMLKSESLNGNGNWKTQSDGRPRAGLAPKEIASIHDDGADASHWSVPLPSRYQINQQKAKWDSNGAASDVSILYQ